MLSPAALDVADRLVTILMTLVRAIAPIVTTPTTASTPTLQEAAARSLLSRITKLVIHLVRISNFGVRSRTEADPAATPLVTLAPPPRATPQGRAERLPRHPGWLLAVLPDIAPAIAADLRALLDDPAIATLLAASPYLHRTLRPLLRGLDLPNAPPTPPPSAPPAQPDHPPPTPSPPLPQTRTRPPPPPPRRNPPFRTAGLLTS